MSLDEILDLTAYCFSRFYINGETQMKRLQNFKNNQRSVADRTGICACDPNNLPIDVGTADRNRTQHTAVRQAVNTGSGASSTPACEQTFAAARPSSERAATRYY